MPSVFISSALALTCRSLFTCTVVGSKRPADVGVPCRAQRELKQGVSSVAVRGIESASSGAAPIIDSWIAASFPGGSPTSKTGIEELIAEAADAAQNDFGVEAAQEWADRYAFPSSFVDSDVSCLRSAQLDFRIMRDLMNLKRDLRI